MTMNLDPCILSRLQFAWVIGFHILLPAFTVGLASYIALLEAIYFFKKKEVYLTISVLWTKIFAISFGMGVVSGVVMPFQLGTNWSRYTDITANILSPLFAYEGLTAFFLEATFLGILLFGRKLIPAWAHLISAIMVALGTLFSSFWILSANSWMHTPRGYKIINGHFFPTDWLAIIFNPSFPYRFLHTVNGFYITTAFVIISVGAYFIRKKPFLEEGRVMFSMAFWLLTFLVPFQILLGDLHGLNTLKYQPAKLAAMEAHWNTEKKAPIILFALPDEKHETNHYTIDIPLLGSLILTHDRQGVVPGLKQWPMAERPPVILPFFTFRIMVGLGIIMFFMVAISFYLRIKKKLFFTNWFLLTCQYLCPIGFFTVIAGWMTTEVGRQPWTVYGLLRTSDSVTPSLTTANVIVSLISYFSIYLIIFPSGILLMIKVIRNALTLFTDKNQIIEGGQKSAPIVTPPEYTP